VVLVGEDPGARGQRLADLERARVADRAEVERDVVELQRRAVLAHRSALLRQ
jgi:hypothetical protein